MFKTIAIGAALALALMSPATAQEQAQPVDAPAVTAAADEVPQAVKDACAGDYEKHCSAHAPEAAAARDCMAHAFEKLSDPCVTAILDSPLVEQAQQQVANARADDAPKTATTKRKAQGARAAPKAYAEKSTSRIAKGKYAAASKNSAGNSTRRVAHHRHNAPRRNVRAHIRRGTGIASRYVAKYTRIAFAKVFR